MLEPEAEHIELAVPAVHTVAQQRKSLAKGVPCNLGFAACCLKGRKKSSKALIYKTLSQ